MSLPPALLARLAQRGLVQAKSKKDKDSTSDLQSTENEEVIAEDYDEMDADQDQQGPENYPSQYDHVPQRKRLNEDSFWLERMRVRMGESTLYTGYKGCPNKYNIWHKCTLYCVNRWEDGHTEPSRDYMRRYKRLLNKYPLPKGWSEMYDPGSGCFYFYSTAENLVSWLPPTHPKSHVSKSAAVLRRLLEESTLGGGVGSGGSDGEQHDDDKNLGKGGAAERHQREIEEIISAAIRPRSPLPAKERTNEDVENKAPRRQKSRDLDRVLSRQRREKEGAGNSRRHHGREDPDILDPMDPSAYSDTPRGKWSTGLKTANDERPSKSSSKEESGRDHRKERRGEPSDEDDDDDYH